MIDQEAISPEPPRGAARRADLWLTSAVMVVLFAAALGAFVATRSLVDDQEQRLLGERTGEVAALLDNSFDSIDSSLKVLGPIGASQDPAAATLFEDSAGRLIEGNTRTVAVATADGGVFTVASATGDGMAVGERLTGARAVLAARALALDEPLLVSDLLADADGTRLVLARQVRGVDAVSFHETMLRSGASPSTPESPFRALRVALYASPAEDPARLVVTTESAVDWSGPVERKSLTVGADRWLLVVGTVDPLTGTLGQLFPWLLLAGGVITALLATAAVGTLVRRKAYALALVAERTAELERALGELGEVRVFLERLLTAGPVLVVRLAVPERQITYVSPNIETLFGATVDDALAPGFFGRMIFPGDTADVDAVLSHVENGESSREVSECRVVRPDGSARWVSAVFVPEIGSDGGVVAVLCYIVDVDDRRRAERAQRDAQDAAEGANRAKSEFLSRMSHELRTPLNAVLGFGQLLEMEALTDDQRDSVDHILKGGRHLLDLINEVLDISRIEAGEMQLSPEPVLARDLIVESVDLIRPLADQRGIQVVIDRSDGCDCYVYADRQRVKQILLNLLSNAVKYNRARGTVALSCEQPGSTRMHISVTDTGVGIPVERLGMLFTPFERLGAENTAEEGTGIGLALSLKLAEAMGGTLTAVSTLGQGSTFTVELPRVEGPVERYERLNRATEPVAAAVWADRAVVLHIEDNLSNVTLVDRILGQRDGVDVIAAGHGRLGLELAREHQPALILLDLHLPDMGGEEVLQRLRENGATASIPVAIVSADATPGQVQRLLSAGATAYLTKPIDVRQLLCVLDEAITP